MIKKSTQNNKQSTLLARVSGFTIVELLIVVVVIAILAAITIVSYNGITRQASESAAKSDLHTAATKLGTKHAVDGTYPATLPSEITASNGSAFQYTSDGTTYCLTITSTKLTTTYRITNTGSILEGVCSGHTTGIPITNGTAIQTITSANCPSTRTRAVDARDNRTYWVQKLSDNKCWMLTNLAYAGGGTNTYNDTKTLTAGMSVNYSTALYAVYSPTSATNFTTEPTNPSTSTDGTGQYGYMYNWCAAMGGQATAGCANATTPALDTTISICPSGWRLPTGNGSELSALNTAVNGGLTNTDAGLRTNWLAQYGGYYYSGMQYGQGSNGFYWTSTQKSAGYAYTLRLQWSGTPVALTASDGKPVGISVRCIAN